MQVAFELFDASGERDVGRRPVGAFGKDRDGFLVSRDRLRGYVLEDFMARFEFVAAAAQCFEFVTQASNTWR